MANDPAYLRLCLNPSFPFLETEETVQYKYLTISRPPKYSPTSDFNFHAGFFNNPAQEQNNYFLLTNPNDK